MFAPSEYGDLIAVQEYFRQDPDRLRTVIERLAAEDATTMIAAAPPSVVAINMTVTSADHKLLAVRRSAAVQTSQNLWTLGPNETMLGATGASGGVETVHSLAFRCLKAELELDEDGVDRLEISWIGYNVPAALVHVVGHARSTLRSSELEDNLRQSQGFFEVDAVAWLPATAKTVHGIIDDIHQSGGTTVVPSGKWLNSAGLAAADWWRWRRVIAP